MDRRLSALLLFVLAFVLASAACSPSSSHGWPGSSDVTGAAVQVDETPAPVGVPDQGEDPAVLALSVAGTSLCSGTLIAPDLFLTARHCVSKTLAEVSCPATVPQVEGDLPPSSLHVLSGDDVATAKEIAIGKEVLTPASDAICGEDLAVIVLDRLIDGITPLSVSTTAPTIGARVTAIGYGRRGDGDAAGRKLLREHVAILDVSAAELIVGEATCQGDSGGPALDESTGAILGVVSRGGPTCDGAGVRNIYTRADAFRVLIAQATERSASPAKPRRTEGDAGPAPSHDLLGAACKVAGDCATGVCALDDGVTYCSRACAADDRCPTHYHCTATPSDVAAQGEVKVCIAQPG